MAISAWLVISDLPAHSGGADHLRRHAKRQLVAILLLAPREQPGEQCERGGWRVVVDALAEHSETARVELEEASLLRPEGAGEALASAAVRWIDELYLAHLVQVLDDLG
jgi:hypothetical protein